MEKIIMEEEYYNPYCPICTGCGEEGCCSPLNCSMNPDGSYCKSYLRDLQYSYSVLHELLNSDEFDKVLKENMELKKKYDEILDKNLDKYY